MNCHGGTLQAVQGMETSRLQLHHVSGNCALHCSVEAAPNTSKNMLSMLAFPTSQMGPTAYSTWPVFTPTLDQEERIGEQETSFANLFLCSTSWSLLGN